MLAQMHHKRATIVELAPTLPALHHRLAHAVVAPDVLQQRHRAALDHALAQRTRHRRQLRPLQLRLQLLLLVALLDEAALLGGGNVGAVRVRHVLGEIRRAGVALQTDGALELLVAHEWGAVGQTVLAARRLRLGRRCCCVFVLGVG